MTTDNANNSQGDGADAAIAKALDEIKGRELEARSERPGGNLTGPVGGWRRPDGYVMPMPRRPCS
jgi:hypothetical protein